MQKSDCFANPISETTKDDVSYRLSGGGSVVEDGRGSLLNQPFLGEEQPSSFFSHRFMSDSSYFPTQLNQPNPKYYEPTGRQSFASQQQFSIKDQNQQCDEEVLASYPRYSPNVVPQNTADQTAFVEKCYNNLTENTTTNYSSSTQALQALSPDRHLQESDWKPDCTDHKKWDLSGHNTEDINNLYHPIENFNTDMETPGNFGTNQGVANHLSVIGTPNVSYMTASPGFIPILQNPSNYYSSGKNSACAAPIADNRLPPFTFPPPTINSYTGNVFGNDQVHRTNTVDPNHNRSFKVQICTITNCEVECPKNEGYLFNQQDRGTYPPMNTNFEPSQIKNSNEQTQENLYSENADKNKENASTEQTFPHEILKDDKFNANEIPFPTKDPRVIEYDGADNKANTRNGPFGNEYSKLQNSGGGKGLDEIQACDDNSTCSYQMIKENQRLVFRENRQTSVYIDYPDQHMCNERPNNAISGYDDHVMGNPQFQHQVINYPAVPRHVQQLVEFSRNDGDNMQQIEDENVVYQTQIQGQIPVQNNNHTFLPNSDAAWPSQPNPNTKFRRPDMSSKYDILPNKQSPTLPSGIFFQSFPNTAFFTCPPPPQWCNSGVTSCSVNVKNDAIKCDNVTADLTLTNPQSAFGITKKPKKKREGGKNRVLKLFNCPDPNCSKRFNKDSELRVHDNKHHKKMAKPYECGICNKSFKRPDQLKRHQKIHTGEKPHKCQICGRCFARTDHRNTHLSKHTGEKQIKSCRISGCNKRFNNLGELRRHESTSHIELTTSQRKVGICSTDPNVQNNTIFSHPKSKTNENHCMNLGVQRKESSDSCNTLNYGQLKPALSSVMLNEPYLKNSDVNQPIEMQQSWQNPAIIPPYKPKKLKHPQMIMEQNNHS